MSAGARRVAGVVPAGDPGRERPRIFDLDFSSAVAYMLRRNTPPASLARSAGRPAGVGSGALRAALRGPGPGL